MEQETQNQQPLTLAQSILSALPEGEIDKLFDERIDNRRHVVDTILSRLERQDEESQWDTLQSIPLAMLMDGRYMEAANFVGLTIARGWYFDINIIIEVIQNLGTSLLLSMDEWDEPAEDTLRGVLYWFCEYVLTLDWYNKNPIIYIALGSIYEREGKSEIAIQAYNEALKLWSTDAYICIASLYEKSWRYTESAEILKQAYDTTKDNKFLQWYISALSKSGNRKEAYEHYLKLTEKVSRPMLQGNTDSSPIILPTSGLPPFIVFTEEVHSDTDLDDFMDLIVDYHTEATYFPSIHLRNIAEKATIYISNEIEWINKILRELMSAPRSDWNDEQITIYRELVKRRLYLMQTHVIILQNDHYLDAYLHDMHELSLSENPEDHKILREFFDKYFNPYTQAAYDYITDGGGWDIEKMEVLERVKIHLVHIKALFSQGTFFETIRDDIEPFIDDCLVRTNEWTDISIEDSELELHYSQRSSTSSESTQTVDSDEGDIEMIKLQKEEKNYEALNAATMDMYEQFARFLDVQYGTFYRRSVQQLVRDRAALPASAMWDLQSVLIKHNWDKERAFREVIYNMPALVENPYVALFFFIEKVLLGDDWLEEWQTIDQWIDKYWFDQVGLSDAVLWVCILNENWYPEEAAEFIIRIPGILGVPQALHIVMESIRYMDDGDDDIALEGNISRSTGTEWDKKVDGNEWDTENNESNGVQEFVKALNEKCSEEYGIDNFFEYFDWFMKNVLEDKHATDIEIWYTLLASGNMRCIQSQSENMAIAEFVAAWEYGIAYGYISAADILQDMDKHTDALGYFLMAHELAPSIITIRRLLNLYMETGNLKEAWKLIDNSIRDGYDIVWYTSAYYLCEWKTKEALRRFCRILNAWGDIDSAFPDWYEEEIAKYVKNELDIPTTSIEDFEAKILWSYVFADRMSTDPHDYLNHTQTILKLLEKYPLEDACTIISKTIPLLTGAIVLPASNSIIESSLIYLQLHLERIQPIILNLYKSEFLKNTGATNESTQKLLKLLNNFMFDAIFIVEYFPDSQKYSTTWKRALNFYHTDEYQPTPDQYIHVMPSAIQ